MKEPTSIISKMPALALPLFFLPLSLFSQPINAPAHYLEPEEAEAYHLEEAPYIKQPPASPSPCWEPYCTYPYPMGDYEWSSRTGFLFGVEGLWWTVNQNNLDYAVEFDPSEEDSDILGPGTTKILDYDWTWGGRGYAGFMLCGWDVRVLYTWYKNNSSGSTNMHNSDKRLKASLLHPATPQINAEKASIDSDLLYQTIELSIGRDLYFCQRAVLLHPFFGIQALAFNQNLDVLYEGEDFVLNPQYPFIGGEEAAPARVKWNSDLKAIGLKAGLGMEYLWFCGFGLYGNFAGSLLASQTDVHHRQDILDYEGYIAERLVDIKEKENIIVPGYQIGAGFSWETHCGECFYFLLKFGYEFNQWFNIPQLRRYHYGNEGVSSDCFGNAALHGATLSLNCYF